MASLENPVGDITLGNSKALGKSQTQLEPEIQRGTVPIVLWSLF